MPFPLRSGWMSGSRERDSFGREREWLVFVVTAKKIKEWEMGVLKTMYHEKRLLSVLLRDMICRQRPGGWGVAQNGINLMGDLHDDGFERDAEVSRVIRR